MRPSVVPQITLRELHMDLLVPFETSFERTSHRRILLVEADVDDGARFHGCMSDRHRGTVRFLPLPGRCLAGCFEDPSWVGADMKTFGTLTRLGKNVLE